MLTALDERPDLRPGAVVERIGDRTAASVFAEYRELPLQARHPRRPTRESIADSRDHAAAAALRAARYFPSGTPLTT